MNRLSQLANSARQIAERQVFFLFWVAGLSFAVGFLILLLLQRLGLPLNLVIAVTAVSAFVAVILASWQGRTMSSQPFFYAGKSINPAQLGVSGVTDWLASTTILVLIGLSIAGQTVLTSAIMLALLIQAVLFAGPVQRSTTLTIPGFFGWRFASKTLSFFTLAVVCGILACLLLAEYQVLRTILGNLLGARADTAVLILLAAAVLPALVGGWLSLVLVNGVLTIFVLISLLTTASTMAFLPGFMARVLALDPNEVALAPLPLFAADDFGFLATFPGPPFLTALGLIVVGCGLSVMPHGLSRLALNRSPLAASEAGGWSALFIFLLLSAFPLSIALLLSEPASVALAELMQKHVVFYVLPQFAILFIAFNTVSATLFIISMSIVRALRRGQSLDPGERSIFPTRLLIIAGAAGLTFAPLEQLPDSASLLFIAVSLAAGGLFAPFAASIWFSRIPALMVLLAVAAGTAITLIGLSGLLPLPAFEAGGAGLAASTTILVFSYFLARLRGRSHHEPALVVLRRPDGMR